MTLTFDQGRGAAERSRSGKTAMEDIEIAEHLLRDCAEDLTRLQQKLRAGEIGEVKDAVRVARELRTAAQMMLEERNRVDKLRKGIAGGVRAGELDLGAARDEIGRRLACLRRGGAG